MCKVLGFGIGLFLFLLWLFVRESCRPWFGRVTYCTNHGSVCLCPHGFSLVSKGSKADVILFCVTCHQWQRLGIESPGEYISLYAVGQLSQRRETLSAGISLWCAFCLAVYSNEPRAAQFLSGCPGLQEGRNRWVSSCCIPSLQARVPRLWQCSTSLELTKILNTDLWFWDC